MLPVAVIALWGALWIGFGMFAFAIFAALSPSLGAAGAAAVTGGVFLVIAAIGGMIARNRVEAAKRSALLAGLASSGAANVVLGLISRRPLMSLGIIGAAAAFLFTRSSGDGANK
ncbi:MAG: hypothetical protein QM698_07225 [Micropepsaceae bacterium]